MTDEADLGPPRDIRHLFRRDLIEGGIEPEVADELLDLATNLGERLRRERLAREADLEAPNG